jgi:4-amino-4-deoxy-L-arabinose transferase-like glycosyltransferase
MKYDKSDLFILLGISLIVFLFLILTGVLSSYGYFIDELYYLSCSHRLAFGYIDQPPLSIFILYVNRIIFGDSLLAIRWIPALTISATVFLSGQITKQLGGGRHAMVMSAIAVAGCPVYLLFGSFYSMNVFEIFIWTLIMYYTIRILKEENPKYFIVIGLLLGLGLEMKHTMITYALGFIIGMTISRSRKLLWNKWFLYGILTAFVLLLPNIIWQLKNGIPSLEFYRNAMINKNITTGPLGILAGQLLFIGPIAFLLGICGLIFLLINKDLVKYRLFGFAYLILFVLLTVSQSSRPDRIAAIYPILFCAGGIAVEKYSQRVKFRIPEKAVLFLLIIGTIVTTPIAVPFLEPEREAAYLSSIGYKMSIESGKRNDMLPQWIADRLGWKEFAKDVSMVYMSLPPELRQNTVIVSSNYGEAGALELYAKDYPLPKVYATHNSFHSWGPPSDSVKTYIAVFVDRKDLEQRFERVVDAKIFRCEYCSRPQQSIPIYIARNPNFSIEKEWKNFKIYD